jgi:hypothetical protein
MASHWPSSDSRSRTNALLLGRNKLRTSVSRAGVQLHKRASTELKAVPFKLIYCLNFSISSLLRKVG